jgi:hypothetical protein
VDKTQAVQGATGSTALHVACANGCVKIVDLLIRNNARVDVKDKYGSTPLDVAQAKHETEIINLLKSAKVKQRKDPHHYNKEVLHRRSMSSCNDEVPQQQQQQQPQRIQQPGTHSKKSMDSMIMTHKRTPSDSKQRIRRPSLPSIFEGRQHTTTVAPSTIAMTLSSNYLEVPEAQRRSFSSTAAATAVHRPSTEEIHTHSCPVTPRSSIDQVLSSKRSHASSLSVPGSSPRSSSESSHVMMSSSPCTTGLYTPAGNTDWSTAVTADGKPDWYGYGVVNPYDDENYLLSLERRAYNLGCNENGTPERNSQESTRRSFENKDSLRRLSNADDSIGSSNTNHQQDNKSAAKARSNSVDAVVTTSSDLLRTTALKNAMAAQSNSLSTTESTSLSADDEYDEEENAEEDEVTDDGDEEEEEEYQSEPLPRSSVVLDDGLESDLMRYRFQLQQEHQQTRANSTNHPEVAKKGWFSTFGKEMGRHSLDNVQRKSLDLRPNLDHLTHFVAKKVGNNQQEESSDEDEQQQQKRNSGFFSRWAPAWSKK